MSDLSKRKNHYFFNFLLMLVLSGVVIYIVTKNHAIAIIPMLQGANKWYLLLIVVLMICTRLAVGFSLRTACRLSHPKYSWWKGILNSFTGGFFNMITPSASGGQIAQVYIFKKQGVPLHHAASVLWMDFIVYQTTMILSVLVLLFARFHTFYTNYSKFFIIVIFGFLVNAAVIAFLWAVVKMPRFYNWISTTGLQIAVKFKLVKDPEKAKANLFRQVNRFEQEAEVLSKHPKVIAIMVAMNAIQLVLYYAIPFFCARALHIEVGYDRFIDIMALSAFVMMINAFLPMPGSSGGTEATFVFMFSTIFGRAQAGQIMIVWRFFTYYFMLLLGGLMFLIAKLQKDIPALESVPQSEKEKACE